MNVLPAQVLEIELGDEHLPARSPWPAVVAYSSAAAAVLVVTVASVLGVLSQNEQLGSNRSTDQTNLAHRQNLARAANVGFLLSGALAAVSTYTFVRHREHIFQP